MKKTFNLIVIGTGSAASTIAMECRSAGWSVAVIESRSAAQAGVATKYSFHQMPKVDRAWCPYCVVDAATHFATFALAVPEAISALRR